MVLLKHATLGTALKKTHCERLNYQNKQVLGLTLLEYSCQEN